MIREVGADRDLPATPGTCLVPGHWWPVALGPLYWIAECLPSTRETARRLGLVTLEQMVAALVRAVEDPPAPGTVRVVDVPAIRARRLSQGSGSSIAR